MVYYKRLPINESGSKFKALGAIRFMANNTGKIAMDYVKAEISREGNVFEKGRNGWDLTIKNRDGTEIPIEVKGIVETNGFVLLSDYNTDFKGIEGLPKNWEMWVVIVSKKGAVKKLLKWDKQEVIRRLSSKHNPYRTWQVNFRTGDLQ